MVKCKNCIHDRMTCTRTQNEILEYCSMVVVLPECAYIGGFCTTVQEFDECEFYECKKQSWWRRLWNLK